MSVYVWALYSCFPDIFVCVMTPPESVLHVSFNLCLSVCNIHVRVHVCWLTIDKKQDQDQAAQGQREGSREKAVQDRAPNSPHCVLKSCVACMCICECVCVWMCTFDQSLLCDPAATAKLVHTHTELICSQQQRRGHVHAVTAQLYFSAIRQKLLFKGNLTKGLIRATQNHNTWKINCFGCKVT